MTTNDKIKNTMEDIHRLVQAFVDYTKTNPQDNYTNRILDEFIGLSDEIRRLYDIRKPTKNTISYQRLLSILQTYVSTDAESAEPIYVTDLLCGVCGCTPAEIEELGFSDIIVDTDDIN